MKTALIASSLVVFVLLQCIEANPVAKRNVGQTTYTYYPAQQQQQVYYPSQQQVYQYPQQQVLYQQQQPQVIYQQQQQQQPAPAASGNVVSGGIAGATKGANALGGLGRKVGGIFGPIGSAILGGAGTIVGGAAAGLAGTVAGGVGEAFSFRKRNVAAPGATYTYYPAQQQQVYYPAQQQVYQYPQQQYIYQQQQPQIVYPQQQVQQPAPADSGNVVSGGIAGATKGANALGGLGRKVGGIFGPIGSAILGGAGTIVGGAAAGLAGTVAGGVGEAFNFRRTIA